MEFWATLVSVIVGGVLTVGGTYLIESRKTRLECRNLALAVAAEAAAAATIVEYRHWIHSIETAAASARTGNVYAVTIHLPDPLLPIARAAQMEAGKLPGTLPVRVPRLVMYADGIASDLRRLAIHRIDEPDSIVTSADPQQAVEFYEDLAVLLRMAVVLCWEIFDEVRKAYPGEGGLAPTGEARRYPAPAD